MENPKKSNLHRVSEIFYWIAIFAISITSVFDLFNRNFQDLIWKVLVISWMIYGRILECEIGRLKEAVKDFRKKLKLED